MASNGFCADDVGPATSLEGRLLRHLLASHEQLRQSVANQVHEELVQRMIGVLFQLQILRQHQANGSEEDHASLNAAMQFIHEGIEQACGLVNRLRPPSLDDFGLISAIAHLICESDARGGPYIEFLHTDEGPRPAAAVEDAAFRIAEELLGNAIRHSRSRKIRVLLTQEEAALCIEVEDWGDGFDPDAARAGGFGLDEVRLRTSTLGGELQISSAPGQGTHAVVHIPLKRP